MASLSLVLVILAIKAHLGYIKVAVRLDAQKTTRKQSMAAICWKY